MWQHFLQWFRRLRPAGAGPGAGGDDAGAAGERLAAEFLQARGFQVVARNWRSPRDRRDELDLVCRDGEALVIVEVKSRAAGALVPGYFTLNHRKKKVLRRAGADYLRGLRPRPATFRLDVVELATHPGREPEIRHFENVPLFAKHWRP